MEKYRHLKEHIFDEDSSRKLSTYADDGKKEDIKAGDFLLHGRIYSLPHVPVPPLFMEHVLYLQQYAVMDMDASFYTHRKNYDSFLILFTLAGCGSLKYRGKDYLLSEGDGFLIDCRDEHSYHTAGDRWEHIVLHFNGRDATFFYQTYFADGSPLFHFANPAHCHTLISEIVDSVCSMKANRDFCTSIRIQTLLAQIWDHRIESAVENETADHIRLLCKYIENHFSEALTLKELAAFCGFHPSYLCRAFKKETGYSPKEYITVLRLEQAKELLYSTSIPAYKVGVLVGIPDETNFTRLFKKYFHETPGEYRNKIG